MKRYLLTDDAKQDLKGIRLYLTREAGQRIAKSAVAKIKDSFEFLSRTPGAGHSREDLTGAPLKFWSVYSYLIIYDSAKRPIEIVRVLHGHREVDAILSQDDD